MLTSSDTTRTTVVLLAQRGGRRPVVLRQLYKVRESVHVHACILSTHRKRGKTISTAVVRTQKVTDYEYLLYSYYCKKKERKRQNEGDILLRVVLMHIKEGGRSASNEVSVRP